MEIKLLGIRHRSAKPSNQLLKLWEGKKLVYKMAFVMQITLEVRKS